MNSRVEHNVEALKSLLPLLEVHLLSRLTPKALWVSMQPAGPGRPPEPCCDYRCSFCPRHRAGCTLREESVFAEWRRLRAQYPELTTLERLLDEMMSDRALRRWAHALYWEYIQHWDAYEPERREEWARQGLLWLAVQFRGWLPVYVPEGMPQRDQHDERVAEMLRLRIRGFSFRRIAKEVGVPKTTVARLVKERLEPERS